MYSCMVVSSSNDVIANGVAVELQRYGLILIDADIALDLSDGVCNEVVIVTRSGGVEKATRGFIYDVNKTNKKILVGIERSSAVTQRKFVRVPLDDTCLLEVISDGVTKIIPANTRNISLGGMSFGTLFSDIGVGDCIKYKLMCGGEYKSLEGKVVWSKGSTGVMECGVSFDTMCKELEDELFAFIVDKLGNLGCN